MRYISPGIFVGQRTKDLNKGLISSTHMGERGQTLAVSTPDFLSPAQYPKLMDAILLAQCAALPPK